MNFQCCAKGGTMWKEMAKDASEDLSNYTTMDDNTSIYGA